MLATIRKLSRYPTSRIHIGVDLTLLALASYVATRTKAALLAPEWPGVFLVAATLWWAGCRFLRRYDPSQPMGLANDLGLTSLLVIGVAVPLAVVRALFPSVAGDLRLGELLRAFWPAVLAVRLAIHSGRAFAASPPAEILVIGVGPLGRHTGLEVILTGDRHRRVSGYLSFAGEAADPRLPAPVLGSSSELERVLRERPVDEVYVAGNVRRVGDEMQAAVRTCERFGIPFAIPASHLRLDRARPTARAIADGYVHYLSIEHKPYQLAIKRIIDICASAVALIVLSPLMLVVAIAIKLTSRGPVLFRQERVGQYGRTFNMLKFRSMVIDAESLQQRLMAQNEQSGPVFKITHDPRITRVGRFIRKYSFDELPQLVNVLRGEMTIVGPRPPVPGEVAKYEPWQRRRLSVRPGLTCLWQISGRNAIPFQRWMYMDMQYIDHWSLRQDLELILKTVPVVLTGKGAS